MWRACVCACVDWDACSLAWTAQHVFRKRAMLCAFLLPLLVPPRRALFVKHALQTLHAMLFNSETCSERTALLRSNEVPLQDLLAALMSDPQPARLSAAATLRVCTQGGAWFVYLCACHSNSLAEYTGPAVEARRVTACVPVSCVSGGVAEIRPHPPNCN